MLAALSAAAAAAVPQCHNVGTHPCLLRINQEFGKHVIDHNSDFSFIRGKYRAPYEPEEAAAVCSKERFAQVDHCAWEADFRLTIVEPEAFRTSVPLMDAMYLPWVEGQHLDRRHPLHGKVMDVVVGNGTCSWQDWTDVHLDGQILLGGQCRNELRSAMHSTGQRPAAFVYAQWLSGLEMWSPNMGSSGGIEDIPGAIAPYGLFMMARVAARKGQKMRAKFELVCPTGEEAEVPPPPAFSDGCPDDKLRGLCDDAREPEDRLCSKCPLQLAGGGRQFCLYAARLFPAREANYFQATRAVPSTVEVTYFNLPPWGGCDPGDYDGNISGKVVAIPERPCMRSTGALMLDAAHAAERRGAVGVIILSEALSHFQPIGPSLLFDYPVHVIGGHESWAFAAMYDVPVGHSGALAWQLVDEDLAPDPVLPPAAPTAPPRREAIPDETASFEATPSAVVCLIIIVAAGVAIGAHVALGRSVPNKVPREIAAGVKGVPLSLASMALSVSLLVIVTITACALSASAAHQAAGAASSHGAAATSMTYAHAVGNVDQLSVQLRKQALAQVHGELDAFLDYGVNLVEEVAVWLESWDGTWQGFLEKHHSGMGAALRKGDEVLWTSSKAWHTSVKTVNSFYADSKWMSRYSTDGAALNATNDGSVAGIAFTSRTDGDWAQPSYWPAWLPDMLGDSPMARVGGEVMDPLEAVEDVPPGRHAWRVSDRSYPLTMLITWQLPWISATVVRPLFNPRTKQLTGVATSATSVTGIHGLLKAVSKQQPSFENVTITLHDAATEALVGSTHHVSLFDITHTVDIFFTWPGCYAGNVRALRLNESADVVDNALHAYLRAHPRARAAVLDQKDFYTHADRHALNVVAGPRGAVDTSPDALPLFMEGGCGAGCDLAADDTFGNVLSFDGKKTLLVDLTLTTDIPHVAATRVGSGQDAWASTSALYRNAMPVPNAPAKQCVYKSAGMNRYVPSQCSQRGLRNLFFLPRYTVSVRVKPDANVARSDTSQVLFEEEQHGYSQFTLYANGALNLGGIEVMCYVPAAGLPGGVWTTVTARYDEATATCEVWLNATLHRQAVTTNEVRPPMSPAPFAIGRGFKGAMQSARAFTFLAPPEDLAVWAEFVRSVPSRRWYVDLAEYSRPGFDWIMSVRIPRTDVMRDVDENNRYLLRNLQQQEANTQAQLDRDIAETSLVTTMVVLLSVLVFIVFNDLLTRPFANVSSVMCDAAVMRIEEIPEQASPIAELNAMQAAMGLMLANLKEYRSFMPQFITEALDDGSDTEASVSKSAKSAKSGLTKKSTSTGGSSHSTVSGSGSRGIDKAIKTKSFTAAAGMQAFLAVQLTTKRISLAALNVVDFMCKDKSKAALDIHGQLLTFLLGCAAGLHGVVTSFSGDRFVVSFNASRMCTGHRTAAGMLGCQFAEHGKEMGLSTSGGLVSGDAKVGSMGCISMRTFSVLSPLVPLANALERYSRNITAALVCDASINRECRTVASRHAGLFRLAKYQDKPMQVFEVLRSIDGGKVDEWMYELEASAARDPYTQWNECVHAITTGDWDTVEKTRKHLTGDGPLSLVMRRAAERNEYEAPDYTPYF